ncbi:hypothetical protein B0I35DRAFT_348873 [Stachybotrys elegans]|uniref:Rhodopsin domain-containing protein n=1 Tax=Stachybotrys elegans TaxID=80388 RepID=A0A8K0SU18_9HYPO|nr:hypothetical protein B0I35DRAFT_348873 [Stachybotrys elegans]
MELSPRNHADEVHSFVSPFTELNIGLWFLFAGTTILLGLRLWIKVFRKHRLWYDDYILIVTWAVLLANNALIIHEFATGYILKDSTQKWDQRMRILINVSSCGTLIGQAWSKTAFGVTLLRLGSQRLQWFIWVCIVTMNLFMISKLILQWGKICDKGGYDNWYRLDFCVSWQFREDWKEGGNIYNIIMDFVFATIPWFVVRKLELRRIEKIGLGFVMSLGMIVAIVSAVRVAWKDTGNGRDEYYIWRNGMSQIWYSSEITGTIMVQCVPVLRTFVRDMRTTIASKRLSGGTMDRRSSFRISLLRKRTSSAPSTPNEPDKGFVKMPFRSPPLEDVPESPVEFDHVEKASPTHGRDSPILYPSHTHSWPFPPEGQSSPVRAERARHSLDTNTTTNTTTVALDFGFERTRGLSPPPRSHQMLNVMQANLQNDE